MSGRNFCTDGNVQDFQQIPYTLPGWAAAENAADSMAAPAGAAGNLAGSTVGPAPAADNTAAPAAALPDRIAAAESAADTAAWAVLADNSGNPAALPADNSSDFLPFLLFSFWDGKSFCVLSSQ